MQKSGTLKPGLPLPLTELLRPELQTALNNGQIVKIYVNGDVIVGDKQIISGNNIANGILNVGNDNNNYFSQTQSEIDKLFDNLVAEINSKLIGQEKQDALNDVQAMKEAIKNGNFERAKRIFGLLSEAIRTTKDAIMIATHFGWI